jgi:Ser-tRNA(Ala) deacylase AlaX
MDIKEQYKELTEKINENLPIKAFPIRELVQIFRKNGHPITLKTELTITSVHNSGDISGIMCTVEIADGYKMACALTHLIFSKTEKLYAVITDYQRKREKRIKQLNLTGLN